MEERDQAARVADGLSEPHDDRCWFVGVGVGVGVGTRAGVRGCVPDGVRFGGTRGEIDFSGADEYQGVSGAWG